MSRRARPVPTLEVIKILTADASNVGVVQVDDTSVFQVADFVFLQAIGVLPARCIILEITDSTHLVLGNDLDCQIEDLSDFTVEVGSTVGKRKAS
jgi:hypothetical protein